MKSILKNILLLTFSVVMFGSCSLDVDPYGHLDSDEVFNNKNAIKAFLSTCYATAPIEDFNYNEGFFGKFSDVPRQHPMAWGAETVGNTYMVGNSQNSWFLVYRNIRNVNLFIEGVTTSEVLSDDERTHYIAEAKFLRAFAYYFLVRNWGGVPLLDEPIEYTENTEDLSRPRSQEEDIWDFIMSDLDAAITGLDSKKVYGMANKYIALAFRSRAALYAASIAKYGTVDRSRCVGINPTRADYFYKLAMSSAKEVIDNGDYSLFNKYKGDETAEKAYNFQMSFLEARQSAEVIWAKGFDYDSSGRTHSFDAHIMPRQLMINIGEHYTPYFETVDEFENRDGSDIVPIFEKESNYAEARCSSLIDLFSSRDPRLQASVVLPDSEHMGETISIRDGVYYGGNPVYGNDYGEFFDTVNELFVDKANEHTILGTGLSGGTSIKTTGTGFFMRKYADVNLPEECRISYMSRTDWIIIRLPEIYLNYAEAAIETSTDLSTALTYVNLIKDRAGVALLTDVSEMTMDKVIRERRSELLFEGFKYWDMVRRRTLLDEFSKDGAISKAIRHSMEIFYDYSAKEYLLRLRDYNGFGYEYDRQYYQPIPPLELSKHSWANNPGY